MSSHIARIEIYPDYNKDGSINLNLPFSYGCPDLDLMGYVEIEELVRDIKKKLKEKDRRKLTIIQRKQIKEIMELILHFKCNERGLEDCENCPFKIKGLSAINKWSEGCLNKQLYDLLKEDEDAEVALLR